MERQYRQSNFEYWGGIECTINRVRDDFFDQLQFTGHYARADDIERIASLGIQRLRYPVLWELHEQSEGAPIDFRWATKQINLLHSFDITPIIGLVHHGSGPAFTHLLDPAFANKLAKYAKKVAMNFPEITHYTPVNEPFTTARFSGLYGFWYPHKRDPLLCMKMLLNQVKGIILSMKEIRAINPEAKLLQTEDLAKTHSVPMLQYQADFENQRRWIAYDLLCGKVDRDHPLWGYLRWLGLSETELFYFRDNPCPPDICGFNYYLTSERFLDDEIEFYPRHLHGGNGKHQYVDTEAVRIDHQAPSGIGVLLEEAWDRYKLPMAVTEVFLSCSQDEQVRWLDDVRNECIDLMKRRPEIDLRAMTYWALLGEFGWNHLVTTLDGEYECGAFDVRKEVPEETLTASYIREITSGRNFNESWLQERGWWRKEDRFHLKSVYSD